MTPFDMALIVTWHLGALHPVEKLLVALVAFGPFVVLGFVVVAMRNRAIAEEQDQTGDADAADPDRERSAVPGEPGRTDLGLGGQETGH